MDWPLQWRPPLKVASRRLERAGARIRRQSIPALDTAAAMLRDLGSIVAADAFHEHRKIMDSCDADHMDQRVRARIEIGRSMSAADLVALQRQRALGDATDTHGTGRRFSCHAHHA